MQGEIWVLALWLALHPLAGWLMRRARRSSGDYLVAGRTASPIMAATSLLATIFGASAVMGTAGLAYAHGWSALVWLASGAAALWILSFFVSRMPMDRAFSLPDLLGLQGGPYMRMAAAGVIVPAWVGIVAAQLAAVGKLAGAGHPVESAVLTLLAGVGVGGYVFWAGQRGVLRTDKWQFALFAGIVLLIAGSLWGSANVGRQVAVPVVSLPPLRMLEIALVVGFPFLIGPDIYSRLLTVNHPSGRVQALRLAALGVLILALCITFVGLTARVVLPGIDGENLWIALAEWQWGGWGRMVVVIGLSAAILSSADTCLLSAATIVSFDLMRRDQPRIVGLWAGFLALISIAIALWMGGIIPALLLSYTVYTSGLAVPAVAALLIRKPLPAITGVVTMMAGGTTGLILALSKTPFALGWALAGSTLIALVGTQLERRLRRSA